MFRNRVLYKVTESTFIECEHTQITLIHEKSLNAVRELIRHRNVKMKIEKKLPYRAGETNHQHLFRVNTGYAEELSISNHGLFLLFFFICCSFW